MKIVVINGGTRSGGNTDIIAEKAVQDSMRNTFICVNIRSSQLKIIVTLKTASALFMMTTILSLSGYCPAIFSYSLLQFIGSACQER